MLPPTHPSTLLTHDDSVDFVTSSSPSKSDDHRGSLSSKENPASSLEGQANMVTVIHNNNNNNMNAELCNLSPTKSNTSPVEGALLQEKEKKKRRSLLISLTKEEIEEDILGMTGAKPVRRPKKRAKNVQQALDALFPGRWLPY